MRYSNLRVVVLVTGLTVLTAQGRAGDSLVQRVSEAETGFARSMADRDIEKFASYLAPDAIFFNRQGALRGKAAVVEGWRPFFEGPEAPFSWKPEQVDVLESGTLAHSSGPVHIPSGRQVATFNSVWRLEPDGRWRVVFDKGCGVCDTLRSE